MTPKRGFLHPVTRLCAPRLGGEAVFLFSHRSWWPSSSRWALSPGGDTHFWGSDPVVLSAAENSGRGVPRLLLARPPGTESAHAGAHGQAAATGAATSPRPRRVCAACRDRAPCPPAHAPSRPVCERVLGSVPQVFRAVHVPVPASKAASALLHPVSPNSRADRRGPRRPGRSGRPPAARFIPLSPPPFKISAFERKDKKGLGVIEPAERSGLEEAPRSD